MADEQVLMEVRDSHADDRGEHEVGTQFGAEPDRGAPHRSFQPHRR
ncbi:hypothetical protein KZZ52_22970 [Dactylosporangium sp. AC04546]|nr:hypothetical protein [Dactylosporangium sp. AC04546]WVK88141.1 hypothetical protein KZZ52_22970 [Dactylosporangium sp. AC04546]